MSDSHLGAYHGLVRCGRCRAVFDAVANELPAEHAPFNEGPELSQTDAFDDEWPAAAGREAGRRAPTPARERDVHDDAERIEPFLESEQASSDQDSTGVGDVTTPSDVEVPGEIIEEILIEAPPVLSGAFDDDEPAASGDAAADASDAVSTDPAETGSPAGRTAPTGAPPPRSGAARQSADSNSRSAGVDGTAVREPLQSPYRARDITMMELPQPRPFKTATLSLTVVLLTLLLVWQGKTFYLDALAQEPLLRPYLERICRPLACVLPPRRDFARIDVTGTGIDVNPEVPGALEIRVALINRAHFPQPYPPLRVTLSDSEGRIVGRRTYPPSDYLGDGKRELLPIREPRDAVINLAQPPQRAVGYEVELVTPRGGAAG